MEYFDLVDTSDSVIGATDKVTAHAQGQIHRVVAVYVYDQSGGLYVQHHKASGLYDHTVGGHVRQGEAYDDAAKREANEEINLTEPLNRLGNFLADERFWKDTTNAQIHQYSLYECLASANWQFQPNDEVERLELMGIPSIVAQMNTHPALFTPGFIRSMSFYLNLKQSPYTLEVPELYSL